LFYSLHILHIVLGVLGAKANKAMRLEIFEEFLGISCLLSCAIIKGDFEEVKKHFCIFFYVKN